MYIDQFGREHLYGPPVGWRPSPGRTEISLAHDWTEAVARGHADLPAYVREPGDLTLDIYGDCMEPLLTAGDRVIVRPLKAGEALIDGRMYVVRWLNQKTLDEYQAKTGDRPDMILKILRWTGAEWFYLCNGGLVPLDAIVLALVVAVLPLAGCGDGTTPEPPPETVSAINLQANAATVIANVNVAGPTNVYTASSSYPATLVGSVTVGPFTDASTSVVITVTGTIDHNFPGAQTSTYMDIATATETTFSGTDDKVIGRNASTSSPEFQGSFARELLDTIGAGVTRTYYVYSFAGVGSAVTGAYSNLWNTNIKAEVIRR